MPRYGLLVFLVLVFFAGPAGGREIEITIGVEGLKSLSPDTRFVRLVPDRSPAGPPLTESDLRHLQGLEGLWHLDLRGGGSRAGPDGVGGSRWDLRLTDAGLAEIAEIRTLGVLHLPDDQDFTEEGVAALAKSLPRLRTLTVRYWGAYGRKNDAHLVALPEFKSLVNLDLTGCRGEHDSEWPARIAAMPMLESLVANHCRWVRGGGLAEILTRPRLALLSLGPVTDEDLEPFRTGNGPGHLFLTDSPQLTSRGLAAVAADGKLFRLGIGDCLRLESLAPLAEHPGLTELSLRNLRSLTREGFEAVSRLPALRRLRVAGCDKLSESALTAIGKARGLVHLDLSAEPYRGTPQRYGRIPVTADGLRHLVPLTKLRTLDLSGMRFKVLGCAREPTEIDEPCLLDDTGLALVAKLASLEKLSIRECPGITDRGLLLLGGSASLLELDVTGCEGLTNEGVAELVEARPGLRVIR